MNNSDRYNRVRQFILAAQVHYEKTLRSPTTKDEKQIEGEDALVALDTLYEQLRSVRRGRARITYQQLALSPPHTLTYRSNNDPRLAA